MILRMSRRYLNLLNSCSEGGIPNAILLKSHSSNHQSVLCNLSQKVSVENLAGHKFPERSAPTVAACATAVADWLELVTP